MKIVLQGYMASGKSVIGSLLAKKMSIKFIDLDFFIEENEKHTITELFNIKGEIYFRKKESEYLKKLLLQPEDLIISLGGGTPCYSTNLDLIKQFSTSVYLSATVTTIFNRIKNETATRPLVAEVGIENLQEYIAKHIFERLPYYEAADYTVYVDAKTVNTVVNEIYNLF